MRRRRRTPLWSVASFLPTKVEAQRCIGEMRVIVLGAWSNQFAFAVVVILIAEIPIQPPVELDGEPRFRRLKTHRVGGDERSRCCRRLCNSIALAIVFVDSIRRIETDSRCD